MPETDVTLPEAMGRAMAAYRAGNLVEAAQLYKTILNRNGSHPVALHLLGLIEHRHGRSKIGVRLIDEALSVKPDYVDALITRGNILCSQDAAQQALVWFDQALLINPDNPEALYNRGCALQQLDRQEDALASYDRALAINPKFPDALNNRGNVLCRLKRFQEALETYDGALAIRPDDMGALKNRGDALQMLGRLDEALASYDRALAINPDLVDALYRRGNVLCQMNYRDMAVQSYRRALAVKPKHAAARFALCMADLPVLYIEESEVAERRAAYEKSLTALCHDVEQDVASDDLVDAAGESKPFYLPYQGYNDRDLQARYGKLVCGIMAARYPPAQLAAPPALDEPVRVGIVTGFFWLHASSKVQLRGLVRQLDRNQFRLFGYHTSDTQDDETKRVAAICERFVQGPLKIDDWRRTISADAPHVLIYPEIGMDPVSAILAAQRLAPVQCSSWGHPETSGFPTVDYFLGGDLMEPPNGQDHYTERLIRLPNLAAYYEPIDVSPIPLARSDFGLRQTATVYWCGQSVFKYLPKFDQVFARIARDAGDCQFVFFEFLRNTRVTELFRQRLERAFAAFGLRAADYCVIIPPLDYARFIALFGHCDVFLDSIGFTGGNTTLESLLHDLPIVTVSGALMRGRMSLGILKMMGVTETVTETIDDYVGAAVRLARDVPWRLAVQERMSANKHKVYRDRTCIVALEEFLGRVAREANGSAR